MRRNRFLLSGQLFLLARIDMMIVTATIRVSPSFTPGSTHFWHGVLQVSSFMKIYTLFLLAGAGLLAGCNQSVETASTKFNELPPAVQKTARAQAPNDEIADVSKTTENGIDAYKIEFREENRTPQVLIAADGRLISSDFPKPPGAVERLLTPTGAAGTPFSALPLPVQKTIKAQAPNAPIASISRQSDNGRTIYEVSFQDSGKNPSIKVAEDGTLVQSLQK
jgi:uncharacterized membrane protein YkoI